MPFSSDCGSTPAVEKRVSPRSFIVSIVVCVEFCSFGSKYVPFCYESEFISMAGCPWDHRVQPTSHSESALLGPAKDGKYAIFVKTIDILETDLLKCLELFNEAARLVLRFPFVVRRHVFDHSLFDV
jgi:hypothetical protein